MKHLIAVTTLINVRANSPKDLRAAIAWALQYRDDYVLSAPSWSLQTRGTKARVVIERSTHRATCSYCGKRAKGLRAARDAANSKHWFHAKCLAEVSR